MAALTFIIVEVLIAIFAAYVAPYGPEDSDYTATYSNPSAKHLLGTDDLGRDLLSRIIYGTRVSYAVGVGSQALIVLIGLPLGAIAGLIEIARLVRGQVLSLKESDFVRASRSMGGNTGWIIRTHILRNALTPVIVSITLGVPGAMFAEAGLSFIGLGVPPPTPSWGQIIGIYQSYVRTSPHLILYPSLVLAVTMLAWIILGDGLRNALDPAIRS
jgi:ABC-type dipeptide/oligopeptide/nickel transport system permease subunit